MVARDGKIAYEKAIGYQNREERVVTTDTSGTYSAPYLPVSTYKVTAEAKGFRQVVREPIVLNVYDNLSINFQLAVGELTLEPF